MSPITLKIVALAFMATSAMAAPPMEPPGYSMHSITEITHPTASGIGPWESLPTAGIPSAPTGMTDGPAPFEHSTPSEYKTSFSKPTGSGNASGFGQWQGPPSGVAAPTGGPAPYVHPIPSDFTTSYSKHTHPVRPSGVPMDGAPSVAMPPAPAKAPSEAPVPAEHAIYSKNGMLLDPLGFVHVADDGVERSYAANGTVIDYRQLSNDQLMKMTMNLPAAMQHLQGHLSDVWKGVDGNSVTSKSQFFDPPAHLRPAEPTAEDVQQSVNELVAMKKVLEGRSIPYPPVTVMPPICHNMSCTNTINCQLFDCDECYLWRGFTRKYCVVWT
ncbi:hypothetical protein B0A55_01874 [Friedmanniomyces simplex]|uniref:Uncharacterized protein n=1 Tax=Friedmanniomyces simplex TaxID=329884 RepID=A0A4V5NI43_9PEZI|nr:hypothetical protein B0A55_01874 [Friedmanniomyces simplex]